MIRTATVSLLLGLPWIVGIPLVLTDMKSINDVFGWLFTVINSFQVIKYECLSPHCVMPLLVYLQGVLIFAALCIFRDDARKQWMMKVSDVKSTFSKTLSSTVDLEMTSKSDAGKRRSTLISQLVGTGDVPRSTNRMASRGSVPEEIPENTTL